MEIPSGRGPVALRDSCGGEPPLVPPSCLASRGPVAGAGLSVAWCRLSPGPGAGLKWQRTSITLRPASLCLRQGWRKLAAGWHLGRRGQCREGLSWCSWLLLCALAGGLQFCLLWPEAAPYLSPTRSSSPPVLSRRQEALAADLLPPSVWLVGTGLCGRAH